MSIELFGEKLDKREGNGNEKTLRFKQRRRFCTNKNAYVGTNTGNERYEAGGQ